MSDCGEESYTFGLPEYDKKNNRIIMDGKDKIDIVCRWLQADHSFSSPGDYYSVIEIDTPYKTYRDEGGFDGAMEAVDTAYNLDFFSDWQYSALRAYVAFEWMDDDKAALELAEFRRYLREDYPHMAEAEIVW